MVSLLGKLAAFGCYCALPAICGYLPVCVRGNGISVYPRLDIHALVILLVLQLSWGGGPPNAVGAVMGACIPGHCAPYHASTPPSSVC